MAHPERASVAALAFAVACTLAPLSSAAASATGPRAGDDLHVLLIELVVFQGLGSKQVDLLRKEIEDAWTGHGVTIAWTARPTPGAVRVVVDRAATPLPPAVGDEYWSVASVRVANGHVVPVVYASVDAADRVVRAANPFADGRVQSALLLSRVLGRAIAHELAHLLLDTRVHTERGLLRASFSAAEFVAPNLARFGLDPGQRATALRHRLLLTAHATRAPEADASPTLNPALERDTRPCSLVALHRRAARTALADAAWPPPHRRE